MSVMVGMRVLTRIFAPLSLLGHHDGADVYDSFLSAPFLTKAPPEVASAASSTSSALHPSLASLSGARQSHGLKSQREGDSADRGSASAAVEQSPPRLLVLVLALGAIPTEGVPTTDAVVEDPPLRTHINVRVPLSATFNAIDTNSFNIDDATMLPMRLERTVELSGFASPLIVLQFPGFRLSLLSDKQRARLRALVGRALRHIVIVAAVYAFYAFGLQLISLGSAAFVQVAVHALITFSTFMSCAMFAMDAKKQARYAKHAKTVAGAGQHRSRRRSRLPSLTPNQSVAVLNKRRRMGYAFFDGIEDPVVDKERRIGRSASSSSISSASSSSTASSCSDSSASLPLIGRRVAEQLKQASPTVNVVYGDRRRRSQASLAGAKIRVGKAHTQQMPGHKKPQDIYVVRVDCSTSEQASPSSKKHEKHMNPTVMWDITATFDEFQKLERELKREVKAKKLAGVAGKVPHLSSGAVLFVQRELDEHVLHARRQKLQAFVDAVRANRALATSDALRKFCQAY